MNKHRLTPKQYDGEPERKEPLDRLRASSDSKHHSLSAQEISARDYEQANMLPMHQTKPAQNKKDIKTDAPMAKKNNYAKQKARRIESVSRWDDQNKTSSNDVVMKQHRSRKNSRKTIEHICVQMQSDGNETLTQERTTHARNSSNSKNVDYRNGQTTGGAGNTNTSLTSGSAVTEVVGVIAGSRRPPRPRDEG